MRLKLAILGVIAVLLSACGGISKGGGSNSQGPVTIKVGYMQITDLVPFFAAVDKGYFEAENLKLETTATNGGGPAIEAVASGSLNVALAGTLSILQAKDKGLDLVIVADGAYVTQKPPSVNAIMVRNDGKIKSPKDLEGKQIGVNALNGVAWLMTSEYLREQGVNIEKVTWTEVPFPDMPNVLLNGAVDAVSVSEPFATIIKGSGKADLLVHQDVALHPGFVMSQFFAKRDWAEKNKAALERFVRAYNKGMDDVTKDEAFARSILVKHLKTKEDLASKVALPHWRHDGAAKELDYLIGLGAKRNLLKSKFTSSDVLFSTVKP